MLIDQNYNTRLIASIYNLELNLKSSLAHTLTRNEQLKFHDQEYLTLTPYYIRLKNMMVYLLNWLEM
jgi:hypothetical protein